MALVLRRILKTSAAPPATALKQSLPSSISLYLSLSLCLSRGLSSTTLNSETKSKVPSFVSQNSIPLGKKPRVQWLFLGYPVLGRQQYASRLSSILGVPLILHHHLLCEVLEFRRPQELSGETLDGIVMSSLSKRLEANGESGFILDGFAQNIGQDGFARNIRQAELLEGATEIDLVVDLKFPEEQLCPEPEGIPDEKAEIFFKFLKEQLCIYNQMIMPVEEFYRSRGKLLEFDLAGGIKKSWPRLLEVLNLDPKHELQDP